MTSQKKFGFNWQITPFVLFKQFDWTKETCHVIAASIPVPNSAQPGQEHESRDQKFLLHTGFGGREDFYFVLLV